MTKEYHLRKLRRMKRKLSWMILNYHRREACKAILKIFGVPPNVISPRLN